MKFTDIESEISANLRLIDEIKLNQAMVTEIDRHIKEVEKKLNDKFVHIGTNYIIKHFLPPDDSWILAPKVDEMIWNSLNLTKVWPFKTGTHHEISFDRSTKGYSLYYTTGEVSFDTGVVEDQGGVDLYVKIIEDKRETIKLTGATIEIKLFAFLYLRRLLNEIDKKTNSIAKTYSEEITSRFRGPLNTNGNH